MLRNVGVVVLFILLWISAFGDQALHPGYGSDDFMWRMHLANLSYPSFREADAPEVRQSFLEAATGVLEAKWLAGHYAPVRGLIWLTLYAVFGDEGWISATLALGHFLHVATAILFFFWFGRIGLNDTAAFMTAAIYLMHPVVGLPLANANSGMNLYGMFFLLLSLHAFESVGRGRIWPVVLTAVCQFLCQNSNIVFFGIGPLVLGGSAIVRLFRESRPFKKWLVETTLAFIPIVLVLAIGVFMRIHFYGQMGSRDPGQTVFVEGRPFWAGLADVFFSMRDAAENEGRTHQVYAVPTHAALGILPKLVAFFGVALGGFAAVFFLLRTRADERSDVGKKDLSPIGLILLGIGFFTATAVFYWLLRGGTFLHRYYHVGMLGFAPIVVGVLSLPNYFRKSRGVVFTLILAVGFTAALAYFQSDNLRSAASIRHATRLQRFWSETSLRIMETDPNVNRIYVLNAPRIVSPSGQVFSYSATLSYALLNEIRRARIEKGLPLRDPLFLCRLPEEMADEWKDLAARDDWRFGTAVFDFDVENCRLRRVKEVENPNDPDLPTLQFPDGVDIEGIDRVSCAALPEMRHTSRDRRSDPTIARRFAASHPDFALDAIGTIVRVSREHLPEMWELAKSPVGNVRAAFAELLQRQFGDSLPKTVRARMRLSDEIDASAGLAILVRTEPQAARAEIEKSLESPRLYGEALWLLSEIDKTAASARLALEAPKISSRAEDQKSLVSVRCGRGDERDFARASALLIDSAAMPIDRIRAARVLSEAGRDDLLSEAALAIRDMASLGTAMLVALTEELTPNSPKANLRFAGMILGDPSLPDVVKRRARALAMRVDRKIDLAALVADGFRYIDFLTALATRSLPGSLDDAVAAFESTTMRDDIELAALRRHLRGETPEPVDGALFIRAESLPRDPLTKSAMMLLTVENRGATSCAGGLVESAPLLEFRFLSPGNEPGPPIFATLPWKGVESGRTVQFPLLVKGRPDGVDHVEIVLRRPIKTPSDPPAYLGSPLRIEIVDELKKKDR